MPITLPTSKSTTIKRNPRCLLLYGAPKLGKTTILSQLPDTLLVDTEEGSDYVSAMKFKVNNLAEFKELSTEIIKQGRPYKRIAFDTITELEDWCETEATADYKKTPMGATFKGDSCLTLPQGAGYTYLRLAFKRYLDLIDTLAEEVILMGHLKDKLAEASEVKDTDIDLTGKIKRIICQRADAIGVLKRDKVGKLVVSFKTANEGVCGARAEHLRGQEFEFDWSKIYVE